MFLSTGTCLGDDDLRKEQVPPAVLAAFRSAYPKACGIEYQLDDEDGKKVYEIDFKLGRRKLEARYREDGTLVQVDSKDMDDD
jgi:hypothetical protein